MSNCRLLVAEDAMADPFAADAAKAAWGVTSDGSRLFLEPGVLSQPAIAAASRTIEVEVMDAPVAHLLPERERPLRPGVSISPKGESAGTLTIGVRRILDPARRYFLTCEHVLYPPGVSFGDPVVQPASDDAYSPGNFNEVGRAAERAGLLYDMGNECDAALVEIDADTDYQPLCAHGAGPISQTVEDVSQKQTVELIGRTSGSLTGEVTCESLSAFVDYGDPYRKIMLLDLVQCTYQSPPRSGDSGAPVLMDGSLAGIHIGGACRTGYFCKITTVFRRLNLELI